MFSFFGWLGFLALLGLAAVLTDFVASNRARIDYALRFGADSGDPRPAMGRTKVRQYAARVMQRARKRRSPRYEFTRA